MNTRRFFTSLMLPLILVACKPANEAVPTTTSPNSIVDPLEAAWSDRGVQEQAWLAGSYTPSVDLSSLTEYHMLIDIPDDFSSVHGQQRIRFTNNESGALEAIYLRLFPNISGGDEEVYSVSIDSQPVEPVYESQRSAVVLQLEEPLSPGESVQIALEFDVSIPREMGGNYGLFGYFDGFLVLDTFYPMIPVYDDSGWQRQVTPPNGDPTYNDISFYLVQVRAPGELKLLTTGSEISRLEQNGEQMVTFASGPARDFYVAAAVEPEVIEKQVGSTVVRTYVPDRYREQGQFAVEVAGRALEIFAQRFGPYPYTEMELIGTPMQAFGIEYPGVMAIMIDLFDPEASIDGVPSRIYLESTIAHEIAHQWFYNLVGNDQVNEPWLDEALAQYATYLYYLDAAGESAASSLRSSWYDRWDRTNRAKIPVGLTAGDYQGAEYSSIVYGRGPIFLGKLAEAMGEAEFDRFLQVYVEQHAWGLATGESFQALAETTCACDLGTYFDEWITVSTD